MGAGQSKLNKTNRVIDWQMIEVLRGARVLRRRIATAGRGPSGRRSVGVNARQLTALEIAILWDVDRRVC